MIGGYEPRCALEDSDAGDIRFDKLCRLIAESDHIITLPERLVRAVVPLRQFVLLSPPIDVPPFSMAALWHPRQDADPGHQWMRELVARISSSAPSPS